MRTRLPNPSSVSQSPALSTHARLPLRVSSSSARLLGQLAIGHPNDACEREADAVADSIVRGQPSVSATRSSQQAVQRKCSKCEREEPETVQRVAASASAVSGVVGPAESAAIAASRGAGAPLDPGQRAFFEPRFSHDFSRVRVHADDASASLAHQLGARAFTIGSDIYFGKSAYQPQRLDGQHLLAHELTHVLQQRTGAPRVQRVPDESGVEDRRYSYSTNCGWIDWGHTNPGFARNLIGIVREASQRVARREAVVQTDVGNPTLVAEASCASSYEPDERASSQTEDPVRTLIEHPSGVIEVQLGGFGVDSSDSARFAAQVSTALTAALVTGAARGVTYSARLAGFSDCVGAEARNTALRRARSNEIGARLVVAASASGVRGARQSTLSLDFSDLPSDQYMASNSTRDGRKLNRGVLLMLVPSVAPEEVRTPRMESRAPVVGMMSGVTLTANLTRSLSEAEVLSVACALFQSESRAFEALQGWTDFIAASSFSEEDLPSNNISFYRAARGYSRDEVATLCDEWSIERSREKLNGYTFQNNRSFEGIRLPPGAAWPAEFRSITPAPRSLIEVMGLVLETALMTTRCTRRGDEFRCE